MDFGVWSRAAVKGVLQVIELGISRATEEQNLAQQQRTPDSELTVGTWLRTKLLANQQSWG